MRWLALLLACTVVFAESCRDGCPGWDSCQLCRHCCDLPDSDIFCHPWRVAGWGYETGRSGFVGKQFDGESMRYQQWGVRAGLLEQIKCVTMTGFYFDAGYRWTDFNWNNSPFLNHHGFRELGVGLLGFSWALDCWRWLGYASWWQQMWKLNLGKYGQFESFLWGRYQYRSCIGLHIGVVVEAGRRKGFVRPIIGADWTINERWSLNGVYPCDIGVAYQPWESLKLEVKGHPIRTHLRFRNDDPLPEGLIEYRSWGVEGRASYEPWRGTTIEAFAGQMIWGSVRISNMNNQSQSYRDLDRVLFWGLQLCSHF